MAGRVYTSVFQAVAVTAAQDLLSLLATSTQRLRVLEFRLGQSTDFGDAADELLRIRFRRGMTTVGSGGTTPAMNPADPRELIAATATCRANDTTAASAGTIVEMMEECFNVRAGYLWVPTPKCELIIDISTRGAFNLPAAPADSLTMSGSITWQEYVD